MKLFVAWGVPTTPDRRAANPVPTQNDSRIFSPDLHPVLTQLALSLALRPVFSDIQPDGDRVFDQYLPSNQ